MNVKITTNSQVDGNPTFNLATVWLHNIRDDAVDEGIQRKNAAMRIDYLLVAALFVFHQEYHLVT